MKLTIPFLSAPDLLLQTILLILRTCKFGLKKSIAVLVFRVLGADLFDALIIIVKCYIMNPTIVMVPVLPSIVAFLIIKHCSVACLIHHTYTPPPPRLKIILPPPPRITSRSDVNANNDSINPDAWPLYADTNPIYINAKYGGRVWAVVDELKYVRCTWKCESCGTSCAVLQRQSSGNLQCPKCRKPPRRVDEERKETEPLSSLRVVTAQFRYLMLFYKICNLLQSSLLTAILFRLDPTKPDVHTFDIFCFFYFIGSILLDVVCMLALLLAAVYKKPDESLSLLDAV